MRIRLVTASFMTRTVSLGATQNYVWNKAQPVQDVPEWLAEELLTEPGTQFEAVDPPPASPLQGGGKGKGRRNQKLFEEGADLRQAQPQQED